MALDRCKKTIITSLSAVFVIIIVLIVSLTWIKYRNDDMLNDRFTDLSSLKFVAVLFRHGDRAPTFQYNTDPLKNAFPEGKGELTKKGKQHMYKKGQMFRSIYNNRGFLSDMYLDSEILIKTTRMGRTYMSAAMILAGMYPPKSYQKWSDFETIWQPIPIYSDSPDHAPLLDMQGKCPLLDSIKRLFSGLTTNKTITGPLLTYLSEKCGQPITEMNLKYLYDLFVCQMSGGLPLPIWIKPSHIETMKSIVMKKQDLENFFGNPTLQKLLIGPMLKEIGLAMELRSNNSNHNITRKMHLYSGHDISISMTMGFLGNIIDMPDFGASLHLHLYTHETIGYNVKVFYYKRWDDEKGEEFLISNCGSPCKIEDFIRLLENSFSGEWEEECQKSES